MTQLRHPPTNPGRFSLNGVNLIITIQRQAHPHIMQCLIGINKTTLALNAVEGIRFGIDHMAFNIPKPIITLITVTGYNAGVH